MFFFIYSSIVNQVSFNGNKGIIASAGVEKIIKLWSPIIDFNNQDNCVNSKKPNFFRDFYAYNGVVDFIDPIIDETTEEDRKLMAYFDSLLIRDVSFIYDDSDDNDEDYPMSYFIYNNSPVQYSSAPENASSSEFDSDTELKYTIQNKYVGEHLHESFHKKSPRPENDNESVYAKRMHFRYLKSMVENLTELIALNRKAYDDMIEKIQSEPKKKSKSRLLQDQWKENKDYNDFCHNIEMKRKFLLLLRAYLIVNHLNNSYCVKSFFIKLNKRNSIKKIIEIVNNEKNIADFARNMSYLKGKFKKKINLNLINFDFFFF